MGSVDTWPRDRGTLQSLEDDDASPADPDKAWEARTAGDRYSGGF